MTNPANKRISERAKQLYDLQWRSELEKTDKGRFIAIEPESEKYFLGDSFDDAVNAALDHFPNRITYTIKIGSPAALHLGVLSQ